MLNVVILPERVLDAFEDANLNICDVVDPEKIYATLSKDEVGFYRFINVRPKMAFPKGCSIGELLNTGTIPPKVGSSVSHFYKTVDAYQVDNELEDTFWSYQIYFEDNREKEQLSSTVAYLFTHLMDKEDLLSIKYEVKTINPDTVVIIPRLSKKISESTNNVDDDNMKLLDCDEILDELMIHLNGRMQFDELAKLPIFKAAVKLL
ncbi:MAG: hypothetical protein IBX57_00750 [Gammaproteobacteria bacterium]|nr:hypothetical protein [Gammaproteobacteria bacterium]